MASNGGKEWKRGEEEDEVITGLSVTFMISVVFSRSPLMACLLVQTIVTNYNVN